MRTYYFMVLVCCSVCMGGTIGSAAAEPLDRVETLHSYMRVLQDQSRMYSTRMSAAAECEEGRLMQEPRRKLRQEGQHRT